MNPSERGTRGRSDPAEVRVASISGRTAIIVALISAGVSFTGLAKDYFNPPATKKDVGKQVAESISEGVARGDGTLVIASPLPIGTIVASLLRPGKFSEIVHDPSVFDPARSRWVLADARLDISRSAYSKVSGESKTPDLRGMFLRGVNEGRTDGLQDPDADRQPGRYQADSVKRHHHERPQDVWDSGGRNGTPVGGSGLGFSYSSPFPVTGDYGDADETRPKNVAVYYYIKINE